MAVALGGVVYLWDAGKGSITQLCELQNQEVLYSNDFNETKIDDNNQDAITSVRWMGDGSHVAVGTSTNEVQMWYLIFVFLHGVLNIQFSLKEC